MIAKPNYNELKNPTFGMGIPRYDPQEMEFYNIL